MCKDIVGSQGRIMPTDLHVLGERGDVKGRVLTIDQKADTSVWIGGAKENVKIQDD